MHSDAMNQTKIISPRLTKVLGEEAGFTDKEIELYLTFLRIKTIEKKEHLLVPGDAWQGVHRARAAADFQSDRRYLRLQGVSEGGRSESFRQAAHL